MHPPPRTKAETLAQLRQKIQQIEGFKPQGTLEAVCFGIPEIDRAFPGSILPVGAVHEFTTGGASLAPTMGFLGFLMALLMKKGGPALWITKTGAIYPPGLANYGVQPDRITFLTLRKDQATLWAMEEALSCKGLALVVGEIQDADLTATRRLQLAVEESGVTGFLIRIDPKKAGSSSCITSWKIQSLPSHLEDGLPGIGFPRWDVELVKVRNGTPGRWNVECRDGKFHLLNKSTERIHQDNRFGMAV